MDKVHVTGNGEDAADREGHGDPGSALKNGKKRSAKEKRRIPLYAKQRPQKPLDSIEEARIIAITENVKQVLSRQVSY